MSTNVIIIGGVAGSGKSTLCDKLAKALGWKAVHASGIFHQIQGNQKKLDAYKTKEGKGYWESAAAMKYYDKRLRDFSIDRKVDRELLRVIRKGKVVADAWVMPWLSEKGLKIWLEVSEKERIRRLVGRDHMKPSVVAKRIRIKEKKTSAIYKKMYGFDFGKDFSPFHLCIKTDCLNEKDVFRIAKGFVKIYLPKLK